MPEEAGSAGITGFMDQIRGSANEYASLLYLAATLQQRWAGAKATGPESVAQAQVISLLKTRIAQLSRASERKMRRAAVNVSQISKALEQKTTSQDAAKQFDPVLQLLQKQIDHSRQSIQVGMQAVRNLDALIGAPQATRPAGEKRAPSEKRATAEKKVAAKKVSSPKKVRKAASTGGSKSAKKTAARRRRTETKETAGEPKAGKPAAGE